MLAPTTTTSNPSRTARSIAFLIYAGTVLRVFALAALILPLSPARPPPFRASAEPLWPRVQTMLVDGGIWRRGCPVALSDLRVLTVTYRGFDRRAHDGRLVVNAGAAQPLAGVFRRLYGLRSPIRHLSL